MSQLKLLEDFVTLARAGSFVRAAEQRHVTHPAFGRRIRALEAWVGTPLVDRSSLPITLTPEGQVFYNTANQVLEQLNRVRRQLQASDQAATHGWMVESVGKARMLPSRIGSSCAIPARASNGSALA